MTGVYSWRESRGQARGFFHQSEAARCVERSGVFPGFNRSGAGFLASLRGSNLSQTGRRLSPALCQIIFQKLHCGIGATGLMRHVAKGKPHFHAAQSANHHQIVEIPQMTNSKHFSSQV